MDSPQSGQMGTLRADLAPVDGAVRVLVIDGNPSGRLLIEQRLRALAPALAPVPIGSADELDQAVSRGFDAAILELDLPFGTGLEVHRRLTRLHPSCPVILFTHRELENSPDGYDRLARTLIADLDRLRQQSELQGQARARLGTIAAASRDAIVGKDLQGNITCWNGGAERLFGYRESEVIGKPISIIIPPELAHEEKEILRRVARGEATETYETTRLRKDGTLLPVSISVSPVRDADGVVVGASKTARDITRRKRIQEQLRASEARYRKTFDSAALGIAHVGLDGRWLLFNEAVCSITGYSAEMLRGLTFIDITHEEDREASRRQADRLVSGEIQSYSLEKRYVRPDGTIVWVHITVSLARDDPDEPDHFIAIVQDIDDRKAFEERVQNLLREREQLLEAESTARAEAEAANHLKDEFLATLSHELRTPLSNVLTWTRLLQQKYPNAEDTLRRGFTVIAENAGIQAQMISELLDMSRIVSGKLQLDRKLVELGKLVEDAVLGQRPAAESKGLTVAVDRAEKSILISADATRLQQVLWNLLSNAIKFTPSGGKIHARVRRAGPWAELTLVDTGVGIPSAFLPHVFDRFRQAEASTARRFGGLGLGLAIVKQLVQLHGGSVQAESSGENSGSTFIVCLPLAQDVAEIAVPSNATPTAPPAPTYSRMQEIKDLQILAVDNEPATLDVLVRVLAEYGARVTAVGSAEQALDVLQERRRFDILLSDLGMPGMDGFALLKTVRTLFTAKELPAVAITAFSRAEDRLRAVEAGFQGYIMKPYDIGELITLIRDVSATRGDERRSTDPEEMTST